jgi:hypothetical protein
MSRLQPKPARTTSTCIFCARSLVVALPLPALFEGFHLLAVSLGIPTTCCPNPRAGSPLLCTPASPSFQSNSLSILHSRLLHVSDCRARSKSYCCVASIPAQPVLNIRLSLGGSLAGQIRGKPLRACHPYHSSGSSSP